MEFKNDILVDGKVIKKDGTPSQFLKADGSVDNNTYSTSSHSHSQYLLDSGDNMTGYYNFRNGSFISDIQGNEMWMADEFANVTYSPNVFSGERAFRNGDSYAYFDDGQPAIWTIENLSLSATTAVSLRKLLVMMHGGFTGDLLIEVMKSDGTWVVGATNSGTLVGGLNYLFDIQNAPYPQAWGLKGIRYTFSNYTVGSRTYIGQLGITNIKVYNTFNYIGREGGSSYGDIISKSFIKRGGLVTQFLKANGDVDSTTYYHSGNLTNITQIPNRDYADITGKPTLNITNWNTAFSWGDHSVEGYLTLTTGDSTYVNVSGDTMTGSLTSTSFIKSGGTASQFLKADGSVDANTYSLSSHSHSEYWDITNNTNYYTPLNNDLNDAISGEIGLTKGDVLNIPAGGFNDVVNKSQYGSGDTLQIIYPFRGNENFYMRNRSVISNSWSNWIKIWHDGNLTNVSQLTNDAGYLTSYTDTNTTYTGGTGITLSGTVFSATFGTAAGTVTQGNDSRLSNSRIASDVYAWAKSSVKPTYTNTEVGAAAASHTHAYLPLAGGTITGNLTAPAFYETSLRKYKENIQPYTESGLELINGLDIVSYDRIDTGTKDKIGIIADDTAKEFLNEEMNAVDLYKTIFLQAKAIQELTKRIEKLENNG